MDAGRDSAVAAVTIRRAGATIEWVPVCDLRGLLLLSPQLLFFCLVQGVQSSRAVAAQFMAAGIIALFELTLQDDDVRVVDERHYKLVPSGDLDPAAIRNYGGVD